MRAPTFQWLLIWLVGGLAAWIYSLKYGIPPQWAIPAALSLLVELSFYSALGFERLRRRIGSWTAGRIPLLLLTALLPYLTWAGLTSGVHPNHLVALGLLSAVPLLWFELFKRNLLSDLGFLGCMAGVYLGHILDPIYPSPHPALEIRVLGHLLWIRLGIFAALEIRQLRGTDFGFWPTRQHWVAGLTWYAAFLPIGVGLTHWLGFGQPRLMEGWWWRAPLLFAGILWVVALSEEFFFRGFLQQVLSRPLGRWGGLVISSVIFGAAHLPFRHFPNWKFALVATLAGLFYGLAFQMAQSIRASMVTHSLVVVTWRVFYS